MGTVRSASYFFHETPVSLLILDKGGNETSRNQQAQYIIMVHPVVGCILKIFIRVTVASGYTCSMFEIFPSRPWCVPTFKLDSIND